jgi:hypothetical protein
MSYPLNYPTPQNANVQMFYAGEFTGGTQTWVKPQGASFVWFTLIGAGGAGDTITGGGSGATGLIVLAYEQSPKALDLYPRIGNQWVQAQQVW